MKTTVILATSADGKISDIYRIPASFPDDTAHLVQVAKQSDAVLMGAGTLRAHGGALSIGTPQIIVSRSGNIPPDLHFFNQKSPRWLITKNAPPSEDGWDQIMQYPEIEWPRIFEDLEAQGISSLAVLGGGELVGHLFDEELLDEFWFTYCPIVFGGHHAPNPIEGLGSRGIPLTLLSVKIERERIFAHYEISRK